MSVLERGACIRDFCIRKMFVLDRDVCITEVSVLERVVSALE